MSREANLAAQQRLSDNLNRGDLDAALEVFAPDAVDHDPAPDQGPGRDGFRTFFEALVTGFPDAHLELERAVADDECVSIAYTLSGTHDGEFNGVAPTGKRIAARGVQIGRFEEGQIVERWGSTDELGIMQQLGQV